MAKTLSFPATILCTFAVVYCTTDYTGYRGGQIFTSEVNFFRLGEPVNDVDKNLLEVVEFNRKFTDSMYVRIAPQSGSECNATVKDYHDTKDKIAKKHADTIKHKTGQLPRRAIKIPAVGNGLIVAAGDDLPDVGVYYFVVEYVDGYSDYVGGTIYCDSNKVIKLSSKIPVDRTYDNQFDVSSIDDVKPIATYVRIAPLSDTVDVSNAKSEFKNINKGAEKYVLDQGNGTIKKKGMDDLRCYFFTVWKVYGAEKSKGKKK